MARVSAHLTREVSFTITTIPATDDTTRWKNKWLSRLGEKKDEIVGFAKVIKVLVMTLPIKLRRADYLLAHSLPLLPA